MEEQQIREILSQFERVRLRPDLLTRVYNQITRRLTVRTVAGGRQFSFGLPILCAMRNFSCIGIVILSVAFLVGGGTIAAAQVVMPSHPFYGIKLVSERIAEQFVPSGELRLNLYRDLVARRAEELAVLKVQALTKDNRRGALLDSGFNKATRRLAQNVADMKKGVQDISVSQKTDRLSATRDALNAQVAVLNTVDTVLEGLHKTVAPDREVAQTVKDVQRDVEALRMAVEVATVVPTAEAVQQALEETRGVAIEVRRKHEHLQTMSISSTVGIEEDMRAMETMLKEADSFLSRDQYAEAYMLAKTAGRMGEKILRNLAARMVEPRQ